MQPIRKLDTQLANQIAAGEVVERPASVVKELLENSLDAGATCIDIEITSGGCGLIRIRDDGSGIPKDQLKLALSPHATSKISNLDDLEAIESFGFRGEALASISSVSRFTLSSRTNNSDQGWQAEAEGREMSVKLSPAAVAEGTRVDVRELFFNTPARRRFLRTEKTEFSHIEEVVKKVALANFTVAITLKHNSRTSRRYRAAFDVAQQEQRIAAVCGPQFMQNSIRIELEHEGIEINGWLALPSYHKSQTDGQYFYVNNRPVKDRVLSHAIRQAYQQFIPEGRVPAYVLYLNINPRNVDVNVHPTKHEVRFHNARLIHDLLVQTIEQGLTEGKELVGSDFLGASKSQLPETSFTDNGYSSNADKKQHQAYRSLLQSVPHSGVYQGIREHNQHFSLHQGGWKYLSMVDAQHVLLEKHQQLILLSVNLLIKLKVADLTGLETTTKKLLFPEIIDCGSNSEAKLIAKVLATHDVLVEIIETQLTIFSIPSWMDGLTVNIWCLELFFIALENTHQLDRGSYLSEENHAKFILNLLAETKDLNSLEIKKIAFENILNLFNDKTE